MLAINLVINNNFRAIQTIIESLEDAVRVSLDTYASLNLEYMSSLLSVTEESVQKELLDKKIAFIQPESGKLLMADEYLSGDIYEKIEIAERYGFDNNIEAFTEENRL